MNQLKWYFNRLSLMGYAEIISRLYSFFNKKSIWKGALPLQNLKPDFKWYWNEKRETKDAYMSLFAVNTSEIEKLHNRTFDFFSLENFQIKDINWLFDYKNEVMSPNIESYKINYRNTKTCGNIKYIWELNRHQHLLELAKAYFLLKEEKYKFEVLFQLKSWKSANPYKFGVNWTSGLELSLRLISWIWIYNFIDFKDEDFKNDLFEMIFYHCHEINDNFSKYSSANNHLIGEATGLFLASLFLNFEKYSHVWRERSYAILLQEMENQIFNDGVNKEQAVSYLQFALDFFLLAGLLGEKNGYLFPQSYWKKMESALEFLASIIDVNGNVPNIGDSDDGYAIILSRNNFNPYRSLLATGAIIFKRPDFKAKAGVFDEKTFWLTGEKGWKTWNNIRETEHKIKKCFYDGGYTIISDKESQPDEIKLVFDHGPIGFLSIAAHGHADALSFTLNVKGKRIFIDPGTYSYHDQKEWRNYFKGTSAHNTIKVDDKNQSVIGGNFMWLNKAKSEIVSYHESENYVEVVAEHDGYNRLNDPVIHRRKIYFDKEKLNFFIEDIIRCKNIHLVEQFFHLASECSCQKTNKNSWLIQNADVAITLELDHLLLSDLYYGSMDPVLGWESLKFDQKKPSYTIRGYGEIFKTVKLSTNLKIRI